ncbi:hypothetical protein BT96DRAFT_1024509 [Gymnopus androsaceus JB14]|uniref:Uncharacterized protein n=1 Tax=Gymnopus androsaceus JB14 TaxID=1447944 RepID=A0A6A4GYI8_9AGAR|nr:hypothetical protein BT96DRAFT_1024509 [Gymnopus androsaceus JB14]
MFFTAIFPEELLEAVVKCIISNVDTVCIEPKMTTFNRWRYANKDLISFSVANRKVRRICLPFLFACVKIEAGKDSGRLAYQCTANEAFALAIRSLHLLSSSEPEDNSTLCLLLPHLRNLSQINMGSSRVTLNIPLLTAINSNPVSTIIVPSLAHFDTALLKAELRPSDLTKIVFFPTVFCNDNDYSEVEKYLMFGVRVNHLYVKATALLYGSFGGRKFTGLRELHINLDASPIAVSWLSDFAHGHPLLKKISFSRYSVRGAMHRDAILPFIKPFVEEVGDEGEIKGFAITRVDPGSEVVAKGPFREWYITGLYIRISKWSAGRILNLAHTFFPRIEIFTMHLPRSTVADELIDSLRVFSSLRVVGFLRPFRLLAFSNQAPLPEPPSHVEVESAIIQYTSRIAQHIPTIEGFFINGLRVGRGRNFLKGWLFVKGIDECQIQAVGSLRHQVRLFRRTERIRALNPDSSPPLGSPPLYTNDFALPFYI